MTTARDDAVLPDGLSPADFAAAMRAFAGALGDGAVLGSAAAAGKFRDPYAANYAALVRGEAARDTAR